jgi:ATP-dependent RNA helicase DOB1
MFEEDSDALFDVFDSEVPISEFTNGEISSGTDHTTEQQKKLNKQNSQNRDQSNKRTLQVTEVTNGQNDADNDNGNRDDDASNHAVKKFKLTEEAPQPIVADEFQQESTREVANIAGLQGTSATEDEAGIVLSHQVSY